MEHVHPWTPGVGVFGGSEDEVFLYGHVADEGEDEQSHAEHDQAEHADHHNQPHTRKKRREK